jgi:hypothetical protein
MHFAFATDADGLLGSANTRGKLFDSYVQQIQKAGVVNSEAIEKRLGVTLKDELSTAKILFLTAKNKEDVYFSLLALKNAFHDAHSNLTVPDELEADDRILELPFVASVKEDGGAPVFFVARTEMPDLPQGSQILSVDGVQVKELLSLNRRWLDSSSPEQLWLQTAEWMSKRQSWKIPSRKAGELTEVEFKTPKGETKKLQLPWRTGEDKRGGDTDACVRSTLPYSHEYQKVVPILKGLNYCVYKFPNNTLVIRYFSFYYNFSPIEIWERMPFLSFKAPPLPRKKPFFQEIQDLDHSQLKELLNKVKPKLVIMDVRENMGGNISPYLVAIFAKEKFRLLKRKMIFTDKIKSDRDFFEQSLTLTNGEMTTLLRTDLKTKKNKESRLFPFFCQTAWCTEKEVDYEPDRTVFKTETVLLTGPRCMSSCDQFAAILQDNHIAKIAGLSPRGGHSPFRSDLSLKLKDGSVFKIGVTTGLGFRSDGDKLGVSLDGHPALPDIKLWPEGFAIDETVSRVEKALKP